ncbi:MAG: signal peptidase I [archaeon]|nr:signal peptidase I [archaeon]MCP8306655.1 signal peptidase I [archaeon]
MNKDFASSQIDRKKLLKAVSYVAIILIVMGAIFIVPRVALGTNTPFLSVSGPSMEPTLNSGDYIIIYNKPFDELVEVSDIIVFHRPSNYDDIIVHRINDTTIHDGKRAIITKGDANSQTDFEYWGWVVTEEDYIGTYTGIRVPYLGYLALLFPSPINYLLLVVILFVIFFIELYPFEEEKKDTMKIYLIYHLNLTHR